MGNFNIESFLKNGDIVRTRKVGMEKWNTNIIFEVKEDDSLVIDAGINEEYFSNISVGDEIECKVTKDNFEYTIKSSVSAMVTSPIQVMTLRVEGLRKYNNLRKDMRHFVYLFALIKKEKNDKEPVFAVVTDISKGGIAIAVNNKDGIKKDESSVGKTFYFEISLEDQRTIKFEGLIRREKKVKGTVEYGVQIQDIDQENKKTLNEYVDELQNTDEEFQQLKQEIWEFNFEI